MLVSGNLLIQSLTNLMLRPVRFPTNGRSQIDLVTPNHKDRRLDTQPSVFRLKLKKLSDLCHQKKSILKLKLQQGEIRPKQRACLPTGTLRNLKEK
jgi:hypothetical protein